MLSFTCEIHKFLGYHTTFSRIFVTVNQSELYIKDKVYVYVNLLIIKVPKRLDMIYKTCWCFYCWQSWMESECYGQIRSRLVEGQCMNSYVKNRSKLLITIVTFTVQHGIHCTSTRYLIFFKTWQEIVFSGVFVSSLMCSTSVFMTSFMYLRVPWCIYCRFLNIHMDLIIV